MKSGRISIGGFDRLVRITKYTSLACLTLAILSTLVLNIVSSYSYSNIESNAEPLAEVSTSANGACDPTNTNAESCISLSITSSPSTSTGGDDANLSLLIPREGGIATGRHTVNVSSNNVTGYEVTLSVSEANNNETSLVNNSHDHRSEILATSGNLTTPSQLANNTWGYTLTNPARHESDAVWAGLQPSTNRTAIATTSALSGQTDTYSVYYGVRADNPNELLAGNYQAEVVYTATTNEVEKPTITNIDPNQYELGSNGNSTVTIEGTNLASTYKVYIESNTDSTKQYDITNTITNLTDTELTVAIPTDQTNPDLESGDYTIHVVTQGGEDGIGFTYTEKKALSVYDSVDNVRVDCDENMIPIYYTGNSSTPRWTSLNSMQIEQNTTTWFDYSGSRSNGEVKWANAVTVKDPSKYKDKSLVVDEADILGYWVYIPRYAYMVMRRDATDKVVTDEEAAAMGGFNIRFETVDDLKKTPAACPYSSSSTYYYDCVPQSYPGNNESLIDRSAWATHPAFTWGTEELNGFWIGKFETTGTEGSPTVLPNEYHQYPSSIGDMYDVAKSIGVEDPNNKYGNTASTNQANQNNNNLAISTSHMLKNSEWGAVTYLASSKYGAGINNVQLNNSYSSGGTGKGPSGGTYNTADGQKASTTNNIYGVYDMAGGAWEYVMGGYTTDASQSMTNDYLSFAVKPPYVDLYVDPPFSGTFYTNNNLCTWATCGGHALYETKNVQSVSSYNQSWGGDYSYFVISSTPWFLRGGSALYYGSNAGLLYSDSSNGSTDYYYGFRVALLPQ